MCPKSASQSSSLGLVQEESERCTSVVLAEQALTEHRAMLKEVEAKYSQYHGCTMDKKTRSLPRVGKRALSLHLEAQLTT